MVKAATTLLGSFVVLWAEDLAAAILGQFLQLDERLGVSAQRQVRQRLRHQLARWVWPYDEAGLLAV